MRAPVVLFGLVGCAAHDPALEAKIDTLSAQVAANQKAIEALHQDLHEPKTHDNLSQRLDALQEKLDKIIAATNRGMPADRPHRPEPDKSKVYAVKVAGYPSIGPADAKVTLVWIHDYADPYSNKSRPVIEVLRKKYGNDLRVVYRDLVVHPQTAMASALGACAAERQKQFAAYDELVWTKSFATHSFDQNQDASSACWDTSEGCPVVLGYAVELKLKLDKFRADMKSCKSSVDDDMKQIQGFGIGATPTWFINGRWMQGAMPQENFEALIDEELAKANQSKLPKAQYYQRAVMEKGLPKLETP
ncbi:MAG: thioredoxin domain-containing protein [Kofleriaceae bacterium]